MARTQTETIKVELLLEVAIADDNDTHGTTADEAVSKFIGNANTSLQGIANGVHGLELPARCEVSINGEVITNVKNAPYTDVEGEYGEHTENQPGVGDAPANTPETPDSSETASAPELPDNSEGTENAVAEGAETPTPTNEGEGKSE